jgi:hypothetical protein
MRHASPDDHEQLDGLLAALRATDSLTEKSPGAFYHRSKAFLHFHTDPSGLFADVRTDSSGSFERVRVTTKAEQRQLLSTVRTALKGSAKRS